MRWLRLRRTFPTISMRDCARNFPKSSCSNWERSLHLRIFGQDLIASITPRAITSTLDGNRGGGRLHRLLRSGLGFHPFHAESNESLDGAKDLRRVFVAHHPVDSNRNARILRYTSFYQEQDRRLWRDHFQRLRQ